MRSCDIAIAGSGPVAMTAGLALARDGRSVVLLGRVRSEAPSVDRDIRAFALSAGTVNLLRALGLWTGLEPQAQAVTRIDIADADAASPVRRTALSWDNHLDSGDPASWILPAAALTSALDTAVAAAPLSILDPGPALTATTDAHGATLTLPDGPLRARLLLVADGRNSPLRERAGIKLVTWEYPQTALVARVWHERPHGGVARQHFLEHGPFAILPLAGGHHASIVWSEAKDEAARVLALPPDAALIELEQRFGGILGRIVLDGPLLPWPLRMHLARSFTAQRLALLGDAARSVHPIAGQGLNLGLRDVAALVDVITDAERVGLDIGAGDVLARYEAWRRFDSVSASATMDGLNRLFSEGNPLARAARSAGMGLLARLPRLTEAFVAEAGGATGKVPRLLRPPRPMP